METVLKLMKIFFCVRPCPSSGRVRSSSNRSGSGKFESKTKKKRGSSSVRCIYVKLRDKIYHPVLAERNSTDLLDL